MNIDEMRFYITDALGRPIDLNGIDWFMTLIIRSTIKTCDKTLLDNIVKKLKTIKSYKAKIDDVSTLT